MLGAPWLRIPSRFPGTRSHFTYPSPRLLKDIVKLPILAVENRERVREVWLGRHTNDQTRVGWTMDKKKFKAVMDNSKRWEYSFSIVEICSSFSDLVCFRFPMFVYPIHRKSGFIVLVSQWQDKHCLFTGLEQFRQLGPNANPISVTTFYTGEYQVLLAGFVCFNNSIVNFLFHGRTRCQGYCSC